MFEYIVSEDDYIFIFITINKMVLRAVFESTFGERSPAFRRKLSTAELTFGDLPNIIKLKIMLKDSLLMNLYFLLFADVPKGEAFSWFNFRINSKECKEQSLLLNHLRSEVYVNFSIFSL